MPHRPDQPCRARGGARVERTGVGRAAGRGPDRRDRAHEATRETRRSTAGARPRSRPRRSRSKSACSRSTATKVSRRSSSEGPASSRAGDAGVRVLGPGPRLRRAPLHGAGRDGRDRRRRGRRVDHRLLARVRRSEADRGRARPRRAVDTWTIKGISALGSFRHVIVRRPRHHGHPPQLLFPNTTLRELQTAHAGGARRSVATTTT